MSSSKHPLTEAGLDARPSKKPKFSLRNPSALDAPDDANEEANPELAADVIGSNRPHHRRGAVNIDGFDSDSDGGDNFDERAAEKSRAEKRAKKSKDEEDADMFADLEDDFADGDVSEAEGGKRKKDVKFLDEDQIQGQVKNSKAGGHVGGRLKLTEQEARYMEKHGRLPASAGIEDAASETSDSDADDETRAALDEEIDEELGAGAKTKHAPKLDAFNMRTEQDEGRFDDSGNFVRNAADPDAVHDRWLEGTSKKDMKKAKDAMEKREADRRKREREDDARSTSDAMKELIERMESGETVLEALARLGKKSKDKEVERKRKVTVEAITSAADLLLTRGKTEIYDAERELLVRHWTRETGEPWKEESTEKRWEYRWTDARDGGNINGPYDALTMRQWNEAGYFGEGVEFRPAGDDTWSRVADFL
jgi:CD2 antigen cytoplasmic tail-binding protein 2